MVSRIWGEVGISEITLRHVTCAARWRRVLGEHSFPTPYVPPGEGTLIRVTLLSSVPMVPYTIDWSVREEELG